jgi:hypothetical protein
MKVILAGIDALDSLDTLLPNLALPGERPRGATRLRMPPNPRGQSLMAYFSAREKRRCG